MSFTATIFLQGINPYVLVSAARARAIRPEWRKPLQVLARVNGKPEQAWRVNMMPVGNGSFYLFLHETVRTASGTGVGDRVRIELAFDEAYEGGPAHPVPVWFEQALSSNAAAAANWAALSPSRKKEVLRYFAGLKTQAARERNLEKAMLVLSGQAGRFMARSWAQGR
ncbi:DUF1905 domain-containing protein [Polaromonas sp.]|uniref:DUF1905 domain-containing protein n=1 Tax=Polaromonas sp. TaxID=1869339 RepID=UPI0025EC8941|nr:DUF1905 domain-containing protein [Polaromonas sp.]